jgi:hypothetical protein
MTRLISTLHIYYDYPGREQPGRLDTACNVLFLVMCRYNHRDGCHDLEIKTMLKYAKPRQRMQYNYTTIMLILYAIVLLAFSVYTYVLVDPNITFLNHDVWTQFREGMVQIGYHNRPLSFSLFFLFVLALFGFHRYMISREKQLNPFLIALVVGGTVLLSYPFLSHDFFNYMFDAKILTFYGENPYLMKPMDFPEDPWLRFMHWTHRVYPYGPVFLLMTVVPSFLGLGKFILHYALLKMVYIGLYVLMIFVLTKIDRKKATEFATHPFIVIEGLINAHNDFIALALGVVGCYFIWQAKGDDVLSLIQKQEWKKIISSRTKTDIIGRVFMLLSGGIKYISLPYVFISKDKTAWWNKLAFGLTIGLVLYLAITREFQVWYILNVFIFGLIWKDLIQKWSIFLFGLLMSYFPFIYLGGWAEPAHVQMKFWIIGGFFLLNSLYLVINLRNKS